MELFGLSAHVREVCEQLATLGFVALAPDQYHRTAPGVELAEDAAGRERGFQLLHQQTRPQVLRDVGAAIARLHAHGSAAVGMVGLSVGGHVAYLAATEFDLPAVAVVYGGWLPTTDIPLWPPRADPGPHTEDHLSPARPRRRRRPGRPTRTSARNRPGAARDRGTPRDHHLPRRGPRIPQRPASHPQSRSRPRHLAARAGPAHR